MEISGYVTLADALTYLECKVVHDFAHGDHTIDAEVKREGSSLILSNTKCPYSG